MVASCVASSIGINFVESSSHASQFLKSDTEAGVVLQSAWNHYRADQAGKKVALVDNEGKELEGAEVVVKADKFWGDSSAEEVASKGNGDAQLRRGYIDDSVEETVSIRVSDIPYKSYRVLIYFSSDTNGGAYLPVRVNGKKFATEGEKKTYGSDQRWAKSNYLEVKGLKGTLSIKVPKREEREMENRGTIAAVQIIEEK
ncbi:hypothetical protein [Rubritalea tangerina]